MTSTTTSWLPACSGILGFIASFAEVAIPRHRLRPGFCARFLMLTGRPTETPAALAYCPLFGLGCGVGPPRAAASRVPPAVAEVEGHRIDPGGVARLAAALRVAPAVLRSRSDAVRCSRSPDIRTIWGAARRGVEGGLDAESPLVRRSLSATPWSCRLTAAALPLAASRAAETVRRPWSAYRQS